ncbi:5-methyltetrahydropteroyltriglutamate--homocysteine methyltransferase [Rhodospirillaceae bacterium]|jgi:5-methyltetrahydropteroyltriglutamate--homocysteine methyltransferase|nr:5-methyltetrahydropteroyltriglutamate--homocysteine methyltransferase [Rhodospirillaceae bacterium]|tara:strand:- start:2684 stop:3733 length:1050 start_codon:yes stop_codon:yes gene_type:complete
MTDQPFKTTVVGSMPKPDWLMENLPLNTKGKQVHGKGANWQFEGEILEAALDDATRLTVHDQIIAGIDIITDGEQRRTSYLTYITSKLSGFDYDNLAEKWTRNNRRLAEVGQCVGPIKRVNNLLSKDLEFLKSQTALPVKVTLPGPMTVVDSTFDNFYDDEFKMAMDVAVALNEEALALEKLGVSVIQFDEPVFSRYPDKVVDWGIQALDRCVLGLSKSKTAAHICYSYPMPGVPRPIVDSYPVILKALEDSKIDELALEFEASKLDPKLLRLCPSKTIMFGCIDNGTHEIEDPDSIAKKLLVASQHMPAEQIQAAPDCGLLPLPLDIARKKLKAMVAGAHQARASLKI